MAKPSIFSREYKRRMQTRRKRAGIAAASIFVVVIMFLFGGIVSGKFKTSFGFLNNGGNDAKALLTKNMETEVQKTENVQTETVQEEVKVEEKFFEIQIKENVKLKIVYEEVPEGRLIKSVENLSNIHYDISPNKKNIIAWDKDTQKMSLISVDGTSTDITKASYKTKSTNKTVTMETQLTKKPQYIWCSTPKFVSDDAIAYVTNLPTLSKTTQYIWVYEISKGDHRQIFSKGAKAITFKEYADNKLSIDIDGTQQYILQDLSISK